MDKKLDISAVSEDQFKSAMQNFTTGITVVSTNYQGMLYGLTINSFTSVSLSPPLVLFCVNKNSNNIKGFKSSDVFAISILSEHQKLISVHFARSNVNAFKKFENIDYQLGINKCPLINESICLVECHKTSEYDGGDHIIFLGKVTSVKINSNLKPLLYFAKSYKTISNIDIV